ncbi:EamA family transporter [Aquamicrobium terrae]|uniref:Drug/metabolite transporter (DMT)-like permease n=1 Tax=Aquamicrobium terrae TaxID=1324945 RepID=A0ABV2N132_9HYPH
MTLAVFSAVLAAALMHASWNALIKVRLDRFASISLTALGMAVASLPLLPFVAFPNRMAWIWIGVSLVLHIGYRLFLIRAYEVGDLAQTYPLARGSAPLITTIGGVALIREVPGPFALAGILLLSAGTFLMSLRGGGRLAALNPAAVGYALTTSLFIAGYTLADGLGAREAHTALSYAAWLFVCDGIVATLLALVYRGRRLAQTLAVEWRLGLFTGLLSGGAYAIAMWAMTKAPIASVASLRESSILFAMAISVFALGEKMTAWRAASALFIVAGVVALRLG